MNNDFRYNNNFEQFQSYNNYWNKYDSIIKELSNEQKSFVSKQKNVLTAKQNLMASFIDYLFEQHKNSYILSSEQSKLLADEYIENIQKAANSYVTHQEELEKENADLKKQIQQLMLDFGDKNGKDNLTTK